MSAWTCKACGWEGRATQKSGHIAWRCPRQGNLLKALQKAERKARREANAAVEAPQAPSSPRFWQYLPCLCQCGAQIGQVRGHKKRQFVDAEHYERWRAASITKAAGEDPDVVAARKHAEEVAAVAAKNEATRAEADAVPMVTGKASLKLWARCLGFAVDAEPAAA